MARLRSKKGHIATAVFSLFFSFFCFFKFLLIIFFFLSNTRLLRISRKPLDLKLPNLNMFVRVKIYVSNFFFLPGSKSPPRGQKSAKTNDLNDLQNCQSVCCKILPEGTLEIGIEP